MSFVDYIRWKEHKCSYVFALNRCSSRDNETSQIQLGKQTPSWKTCAVVRRLLQ